MQKTFLIVRSFILALMLFPAVLISQSISNTTWKTFNASFPDTIRIEIGSDTIHQYLGSDSLLVSSLFWQYSDTILMVDVGGTLACTNPDTGWYEIETIGDTMTVTLITDQCVPRGMNYDGAILWKIDQPAGIATEFEKSNEILIYPNPTENSCYIMAGDGGEIAISDLYGRIVHRSMIASERKEIILPAGTYLVRFTSHKGRSDFARLVVK